MLTPQTQYVINENNQKTAVLLPIPVYEQLLENLHDLVIIAQRREETSINLADMLERLGIQDDLHDSISEERDYLLHSSSP